MTKPPIIAAIEQLLPVPKKVATFLREKMKEHYAGFDKPDEKTYRKWMNGLFPDTTIALLPAPAIPTGFPANLMAVQYGRPRYALDEQGRLIGLNLSALGLDDSQWKAVAELLDREGVRLRALNVRENNIKRLDSLPDPSALDFLDIFGNPLEEPGPDILEQGKEAILRHFKELSRSGVYHLREARLLIVGQGGAGKTSLKRKLINVNEPLPEQGDTTRGIDIDPLPMKTPAGEDFTLRIWDFGGQNIQHYAHQFFLSGNSLYVLVHNQREQNTNFQYWLNIIEMLGASSPVIIVQNEVAGHCDPLDNAGSIRDRFKNVLEPFHQVDLLKAAEDGRFNNLRETIEAVASNPDYLPHFGSTRPNSFVIVRNELATQAKEQQFILWSKFRQICKDDAKIDDDNLVEDYANTLTFLGDCLHFTKDLELKNYLFLRPKWIIDALFTLLYHNIVIRNKGEFSELDTLKIWEGADYEHMHGKLIRLMENFELCYPVTDSEERRYIVPQRLPSAGTAFPWEETDIVKVIYRYKFMPRGIITRLTCRMHRKIEDGHAWSDAVIFNQKGKGRIFARERYAEDEIWIEATGKKRSDLLNQVLEVIDTVHHESKFANLQVEKLLPCNCEMCEQSNDPYLFNFDYLVGLIRDEETHERCQKSRNKIEIKSFLARTFENGDEMPHWARGLHEKMDRVSEKVDELKSIFESQQDEVIKRLDNDQISYEAQQAAFAALDPLLKAILDKLPDKEKAAVKKIDTAPDLKSKLKIGIPIIPAILSYETEFSWDWNKVKSSLRRIII